MPARRPTHPSGIRPTDELQVTTIFGWNGIQRDGTGRQSPLPTETVTRSTILPKFLTIVGTHANPLLVDLGPAIGRNVSLFTEQLGCKIVVEDLFATIEARANREQYDQEAPPIDLCAQLTHERGSVDGVLCWDLFDYLDHESSLSLAETLGRIIRPGGVLHGLFSTTPAITSHYTQFLLDGETVRQRPYPATPTRRQVIETGTLLRMFTYFENPAQTWHQKRSATNPLMRLLAQNHRPVAGRTERPYNQHDERIRASYP